MRSKGWVQAPNVFLSLMVMMCTVTSVFGQDNEGSGDLDKAFDKKIEAKSTKDLDSVVKLCESAIEKGLTKEEELQAKQLASSALYEHAEQLSRRILGPGKRDPRWRILRSQSLSRLRKSVKFDPEFVDAFMMIAQLNSMEGGKREEAIESIDKAIEMADDDRRQKSKALYLRAILRDDETEQLEDLNEAIKVNPENMDAVRLRAAYYLRKKEPTKAIEDLNSWLDSDPTNTKNHVNVVRELMRMGGRFDKDLQKESIAIIGKAIKNAPDDPEPLTVRAEIKIIQDDLDGAVADASKALKLDPKT